MIEPRPLDGERLLAALAEGNVSFIIVGAVAYGYHVEPRATGDLDIVPDPASDNLTRLVETLRRLEAGVLPLDIPEHAEPLTVEWLAEGGNFQFQTRYGQLDVLQEVAGLTYDDLDAEAEADVAFGVSVRICSRGHLLLMKERSARPQDLLDLEQLCAEDEQDPEDRA